MSEVSRALVPGGGCLEIDRNTSAFGKARADLIECQRVSSRSSCLESAGSRIRRKPIQRGGETIVHSRSRGWRRLLILRCDRRGRLGRRDRRRDLRNPGRRILAGFNDPDLRQACFHDRLLIFHTRREAFSFCGRIELLNGCRLDNGRFNYRHILIAVRQQTGNQWIGHDCQQNRACGHEHGAAA